MCQLITPLSNRIARPLAEGLKNEVVPRDSRITDLIPQELLDVRQAIHAALSQYKAHLVETNWSMAGPMPGDPDWSGGTVFRDAREIRISAPAAVVFPAICRVGGSERDRSLSLRAEMKLPGQALLDFRVAPDGDSACAVSQTAFFKPRGLVGLLYWYAVVPFHGVVFRSLLAGIQRDVMELAAQPTA